MTRSQTARRGDIMSYLRSCPRQRDILIFESSSEASNAAHTLRNHVDEVFVKVHASYDKVFLTLKEAP